MSETSKPSGTLSERDKQLLPLQGEVDPKQAPGKAVQAAVKATRRFTPPVDKK